MRALVVVLAVVGVVAILRGLARTLLRLALRAAEEAAASGMADMSARRGDLTGLAERNEVVRAARQRRRTDLALTVGWVVWLVVPPLAGWALPAYALAAPLWLLGAPRRMGGGRPGGGLDVRA